MALINLFKPTGGRQTSIVVSELVLGGISYLSYNWLAS